MWNQLKVWWKYGRSYPHVLAQADVDDILTYPDQDIIDFFTSIRHPDTRLLATTLIQQEKFELFKKLQNNHVNLPLYQHVTTTDQDDPVFISYCQPLLTAIRAGAIRQVAFLLALNIRLDAYQQTALTIKPLRIHQVTPKKTLSSNPYLVQCLTAWAVEAQLKEKELGYANNQPFMMFNGAALNGASIQQLAIIINGLEAVPDTVIHLFKQAILFECKKNIEGEVAQEIVQRGSACRVALDRGREHWGTEYEKYSQPKAPKQDRTGWALNFAAKVNRSGQLTMADFWAKYLPSTTLVAQNTLSC